jgi:pyruvate,orthophosphate dikinase
MPQYVYFFGSGKADGHKDMKDVLGGKGAGLAEMTNAGLPVPPGFTVSTEVCRIYSEKGELPPEIERDILEALSRLESMVGQRLGDPEKPLLLSVRSGSKFSMPGMMDTILNLGMNDRTAEGLSRAANDGRFAYDSYRRFIQMFSGVVLGIKSQLFEVILDVVRRSAGGENDAELDEDSLKEVVLRFKALVKRETGGEFPQDTREQLVMARDAVFKSWNNPRAKEYRRIYHIPDDLGTAVNVQKMVFGNLGPHSATGVGFTRDPATGAKEFFGEFLVNAQGEDVVAGIRTPQPIRELEKVMPEAFHQLSAIAERLERHYKDVQDFEFTIEEGTLYMLQTRAGKRTGPAAVRIAVEMVKEGIITPQEALWRVEPSSLSQLLHPIFDPEARRIIQPVAKGIAASPGAASGQVVFDADEAVQWVKSGKRVLLVRNETSPDDVHGMSVAQGILTATGGRTSHAAVVGRQMGKPAVVGCGALDIDYEERRLEVAGQSVSEGDVISIDGATGEVMLAEVRTVPSEVLQVVQGKIPPEASPMYQHFAQVLEWADAERTLGVRANADIPTDAHAAVAFGAEGIGLCRTEHMFFAEDRIPIVESMILSTSIRERRKYLDQLLPYQREDFLGLFRAMNGRPVTIRLLDPPLHEFLPKRENLVREIAELTLKKVRETKRVEKLEKVLARVEQLHEFNPMLGHRGCRLGISHPEITRMQARAIFEAASILVREGGKAEPEIMIPLVGIVKEFEEQKKIVDEEALAVQERERVKVEYSVGTMLELPRGALIADEIAEQAEFFSFGTNDLTQMTFGFSRDDAGKFLPTYFAMGILDRDPFVSIDLKGVGELVRIATEKGRKSRPALKLGTCGEHGGDPDSVRFFHRVGLDYVSCSPYDVPVARLAAARAAMEEQAEKAVPAKSAEAAGSAEGVAR